jgi:hypothetical protein
MTTDPGELAGPSPPSAVTLISSTVRARLEESRISMERFFFDEVLRLRKSYLHHGDPGLIYLTGCALHGVASDTSQNILGAAVYEAFMAEMLTAQGSNYETLSLATRHLEIAERHATRTHLRQERQRARIVAKVVFLRAIVEKSLGATDTAHAILRTATHESWWPNHSDTADIIAITRQRVMMSQSLPAHIELARRARDYRVVRPIEYFRTLKRTFEILVNHQLLSTAEHLRPHVLDAYRAVEPQLPAISGISLAKNLAQLQALSGDPDLALSQLELVRKTSVTLGLHGQGRQIDELVRHIQNSELRDALATFRVAG